jgi:hypothetical protein
MAGRGDTTWSSYRSPPSSGSSSGGYSSSTESVGEQSVESLVGSPRKARTPQTARSNKRGIETAQQKVLLQDIEQDGGGLKNVLEGISAFCDQQALKNSNSKLLYGDRYSSERKRIDNKIRYWAKELSDDEYLLILKDFGVTPSSAEVEPSPVKPTKVPASAKAKASEVPKASNRDMSSKTTRKVSSIDSDKVRAAILASNKAKFQGGSETASSEPIAMSANKSGVVVGKDGVVYGMYCLVSRGLCLWMEPTSSLCVVSY